MPLIIFSGYPSCGKSTRAQELKSKLEAKIAALPQGELGHGMTVVVHSDESLGITKEEYRESRTEKSLRGLQMSAVKRDISRNTIVILDSLCYIKGFRYQLNCEAKAMVTPCCVVHVMASEDMCLQWNSKRDDAWDPELLKALCMRYEEPDGNTRWDKPLIPISYDDVEVPFETIWEAIILQKVNQPNSATILKPASQTNYLQELEHTTTRIVNQVMEYQRTIGTAGKVLIYKDEAKDIYLHVQLPASTVSIAQLQRIRRQFVTLNRLRDLDVDRIQPLFVDYLNTHLST